MLKVRLWWSFQYWLCLLSPYTFSNKCFGTTVCGIFTSSIIIKQNVPMLACGFKFSVWKTVWTENLFPLPVLVWHFLFQTSQRYVRESREGGHCKYFSAICKCGTHTFNAVNEDILIISINDWLHSIFKNYFVSEMLGHWKMPSNLMIWSDYCLQGP